MGRVDDRADTAFSGCYQNTPDITAGGRTAHGEARVRLQLSTMTWRGDRYLGLNDKWRAGLPVDLIRIKYGALPPVDGSGDDTDVPIVSNCSCGVSRKLRE